MVSVRPAEERQGIDITIGDAPTADVRGTVTGMTAGAQGGYVFLVPGGAGTASVAIDGGGRFSFTGVPPGDYTVAARVPTPKDKPAQAWWGRTTVSVFGQTMDNLFIDLRPARQSAAGSLSRAPAPRLT